MLIYYALKLIPTISLHFSVRGDFLLSYAKNSPPAEESASNQIQNEFETNTSKFCYSCLEDINDNLYVQNCGIDTCKADVMHIDCYPRYVKTEFAVNGVNKGFICREKISNMHIFKNFLYIAGKIKQPFGSNHIAFKKWLYTNISDEETLKLILSESRINSCYTSEDLKGRFYYILEGKKRVNKILETYSNKNNNSETEMEFFCLCGDPLCRKLHPIKAKNLESIFSDTCELFPQYTSTDITNIFDPSFVFYINVLGCRKLELVNNKTESFSNLQEVYKHWGVIEKVQDLSISIRFEYINLLSRLLISIDFPSLLTLSIKKDKYTQISENEFNFKSVEDHLYRKIFSNLQNIKIQNFTLPEIALIMQIISFLYFEQSVYITIELQKEENRNFFSGKIIQSCDKQGFVLEFHQSSFFFYNNILPKLIGKLYFLDVIFDSKTNLTLQNSLSITNYIRIANIFIEDLKYREFFYLCNNLLLNNIGRLNILNSIESEETYMYCIPFEFNKANLIYLSDIIEELHRLFLFLGKFTGLKQLIIKNSHIMPYNIHLVENRFYLDIEILIYNGNFFKLALETIINRSNLLKILHIKGKNTILKNLEDNHNNKDIINSSSLRTLILEDCGSAYFNDQIIKTLISNNNNLKKIIFGSIISDDYFENNMLESVNYEIYDNSNMKIREMKIIGDVECILVGDINENSNITINPN